MLIKTICAVLLVASPVFALGPGIFSGSVIAGGGACSSQGVVITQASGANSADLYDDKKTRGQSFSGGFDNAAQLYSITVRLTTPSGATGAVSMRLDDDSDMSAEYLYAATDVTPTAGQTEDVEFIFSDKPAMDNTTTYYIEVTKTGTYANRSALTYDDLNNNYYTGGSFCTHNTTTAWTVGTCTANKDMYFILKVCQ